MALPPRGNRMSSHRIHTYCVCSPTDFHSSGGILASAASKCLPQISQNSQNFLLSVFSHRFHRFTQMVRVPSRGCTCLKCTNLARSAPTEQNRYSPTESTELTELLAECILPQISQICTDGLGAFKGVHLSQVHQRNKGYIYIARLVHFLFWQAAKPSGDKCTP